MDANTIGAGIGLLFALGLFAFLAWETGEGWRKGRFLLRGTTTVTRRKHPGQFYFGLVYKLALMAMSLIIAIYSGGRLAGLWGAL